MSHYDIEVVRDAAATRWAEIVSHLAGIDSSVLDGKHHPCPKCGGTDRFRFFADETGGAICNQCFTTKNGDGFSVVQWLLGRDFVSVLGLVADYLGVKPSKNVGGGQEVSQFGGVAGGGREEAIAGGHDGTPTCETCATRMM